MALDTVVIGSYRLWASAIGAALGQAPGLRVAAWGVSAELERVVGAVGPAVAVLGTVRFQRPFGEAVAELVQRVRSVADDCRIVVTSLSAEPAVVRAAFAAGAVGFVAADDDLERLAEAVREAGAGAAYVSPAAVSSLAHEAAAGTTLNEREARVLERVARGWSSMEIAADLHVTVRTVEADRSSIGRKLGLHGRREVVAWAISRGLVA